jgi:DNA-binding FadR family transcriptional regulator
MLMINTDTGNSQQEKRRTTMPVMARQTGGTRAGSGVAAPALSPARTNGNGAPGRGCISIGSGGGVLRPLKTAESVARDIVHDIIEAGLQPGSALPSEAAMLDHYRVSRESLREGLRLLEVQGLISIRRGPGGGPVVGTVDPANLGRVSTLFFHMSGATYAELFEVWRMAEVMLAERASRNPDGEARAAAMAPYLAPEAPGAGEDDLERFVEAHAGFHGAIASLVGNRVLELTLQTYGQIVSHHLATVQDPRDIRQMLADDHRELARAVAAGHPRRARELMDAHIAGVAAHNREQLGDRVDDFIEWL